MENIKIKFEGGAGIYFEGSKLTIIVLSRNRGYYSKL